MKSSIVFVYHSMNVGGAEKELLAYIEHLDKHHCSIHLILTRKEGELLQDIPAYVHLHQSSGNSNRPDVSYLFHLYQTLNSIKPDIVIGFMQDINFNILLLKVCTSFFLKFKVILSEQVVLSDWQSYQKTFWLKALLIRRLYQSADAIFAQSESIFEDLESEIGVDQAKITLIPSFVSTREFLVPKKKSEQKAELYFLFVGRLDFQKNLELLFKAFSKVARRIPDLKLYIVAPIHTPFYQELSATLGIEKKVVFKGYVSKPAEYYKSALALVIPSFVEGRSRVMIEAMLSSCPVICADFTGHDKYIKNGKTGLVFRRESISNLVECLNYALKNRKELRRIAMNSKDFILKNHIQTHNRNYSVVFKTAIQNVLDQTDTK